MGSVRARGLLRSTLSMRGLVVALYVVVAVHAAAGEPPPCPGDASITVFVENLSTDDGVDVALDGELAADAATCAGAGATRYVERHFRCEGHGTVRCGELTGLRPELWVHRLSVSVAGSDPQHQSQRMVVVGSGGPHVSNALLWT
jgi:hypothetical protein